MNKYRFAIIGCRHLHMLEFIDEMLQLGHEFVGIYEAENKSYCDLVVQKYQVKVFNTLDELLREEIDIVGCADINAKKIDVIELCEQHNIHIMVDKPIITNQVQYERLEKVVTNNRIQVGLMLTERFQPAFNTLKTMIDDKEFGVITHIYMRKPHRLLKEKREEWFFSKELSGGIIVDLLIHDFDLVRWLTGMNIMKLAGYLSKSILPEYESFYDTVSLSMLLDDGTPVQLYADWHTPTSSWTWGDGRVFITGSEGSAEIRLQGDPFIDKQSLLFFGNHQEPIKKITLRKPNTNLAEDFINRIEGKPHVINHLAILSATKDTLIADSLVTKINRSLQK